MVSCLALWRAGALGSTDARAGAWQQQHSPGGANLPRRPRDRESDIETGTLHRLKGGLGTGEGGRRLGDDNKSSSLANQGGQRDLRRLDTFGSAPSLAKLSATLHIATIAIETLELEVASQS